MTANEHTATAFFVLLVICLSVHPAPPQATTNTLLLLLMGAGILYERLCTGSCVSYFTSCDYFEAHP